MATRCGSTGSRCIAEAARSSVRSTSRSPRARSQRCWAPTAPANRAWYSPSAASCVHRPARSCIGDIDYAAKRPERIRRAGVAIVPEGRRLLSELTVEDNIRVATYSLPRAEAAAGRKRALELFPELERRMSAPARALSGGEQQMVVLAQALVSRPRYILIDELSLGLAPVIVNRLIPTIRKVADSGIGVLLIEQFVTVALGLANRAHIMEGGRLQFSGLAAQLRDNPELLHSAYLLRGSDGASRLPAVAGPEPTG